MPSKVLVSFHPHERNFPTDATKYLQELRIVDNVPTYTGDDSSAFDPDAPLYYRRKPDGDWQFWLFYVHNDAYKTCGCCQIGAHEADWEHFTVGKSSVYLGAHGKREGVHHPRPTPGAPIHVAVARGGHGFYKPGGPSTVCRLCGLANDHISDEDGIQWEPHNLVELTDDSPIVMHAHDWGQRGVSSLKSRTYWNGPEPSYSRKPIDCFLHPFVLLWESIMSLFSKCR